VFRVPQRGTTLPVVAPPDRPTWHGTLTARPEPGPARIPQAATNGAASDRLHVAPWESFPAPWGEPENPIPYVLITTQAWPEEWWRPSTMRARTDIRSATDLPESRLDAAVNRVAAGHEYDAGPDGAGLNGSTARPTNGQHGPSRIGVIPVVRGGAMPTARDVPATASTLLQDDRAKRRESHVQAAAEVRAQRADLERERLALARSRRKGTLARLAIFAVGLVISLIAVETASRRRS